MLLVRGSFFPLAIRFSSRVTRKMMSIGPALPGLATANGRAGADPNYRTRSTATRRAASAGPGTIVATLPPKRAISRTRVELT